MLVHLLAAALATQPAPTPAEAAMLACSGKPDAERLACFDRVAAALAGRALERLGAASDAPAADAPTRRGLAPGAAAAQAAAAARGEPLRAPDAGEVGASMPTPAASAEARPEARSAPPPREAAPGRFEGAIASVAFDPYGDAIVTLADGQVWRQLRSDSRKLRERDAEAAERVVVKRGAFGSHRMTVEPLGRTIRVRRAD